MLICPLFNVQKNNLFALDGISSIYFVKRDGGVQVYEEQSKNAFSQLELSENEGVILTFENNSLENVSSLLDMKIVKKEVVDGIESVYGWTNLYEDFVCIDGKQTNVQLVARQGEIVAGFPVVLSGF